ncbi:hypothetical protein [Microbulbifer sp. GL-2]|uniref:hypothetical protein n=1 Tax=Microbulbifer sp. GL-2 TaxID=2591606 RepID=UPI001161DDC0|nr:hypothetical protein [Microbulbifer sp. GL-2]BBM04002.1 hypothetical protein GL2_40760 [Microbulbifer sp. GL-2]
MSRAIILIVIVLFPNIVWATSFACGKPEVKENDERITFEKMEGDSTGGTYKVHLPKIEKYKPSLVWAVFSSPQNNSAGAAELKIEDKGATYVGKLLYAGSISVKIKAEYIDGFGCRLAIENEQNHNK